MDDDVNFLFGENKKMDHLIVIDNVSGVADISRKFATSLTVSRKCGYHCVCFLRYCNFIDLAKNYFTK